MLVSTTAPTPPPLQQMHQPLPTQAHAPQAHEPSYAPQAHAPPPPDALGWETELFLLHAPDRAGLLRRIDELLGRLDRMPAVDLLSLAAGLAEEFVGGQETLAVVAGSVADLHKRLSRAAKRLADPACRLIRDGQGLYYTSEPLGQQGGLAVLFPGESAQYPNMLLDLAQYFPEVAESFDWCEQIAQQAGRPERSIKRIIWTSPTPTPDELAACEARLRILSNSIFSVVVADLAIYRLLEQLGVPVSALAGHSAGELAAALAGRTMPNERLLGVQFIQIMDMMQRQEDSGDTDVLLLAVGLGRSELRALTPPEVIVAMDNCPHQAVAVGPIAPMQQLERTLQERGIIHERLPFRRPYHTPLFEPWMGEFRALFAAIPFSAPRVPIYSAVTAAPLPSDPQAVRELILSNWVRPVEFTQTIRNLHADGVRIFVEAGPRGNLSAFVEDILRHESFVALPANLPRRSGLTQLNHLVGQLAVHQVPIRPMHLFARRMGQRGGWPSAGTPLASAGAATDWSAIEQLGGEREQVMQAYFEAMTQFLHTQQAVMLGWQVHGHAPALALAPAPAPDTAAASDAAAAPPLALLGQIVAYEPGQSLTTRRLLDLREDWFVHDHTIGGRAVSRIDPTQNGLPILPMTFSLEIMAELACTLLPGLVVTAIEQVKLLRWLPYDEATTTLEATATVLPEDGSGRRRVKVRVRDTGNRYDRGVMAGQTAAEGVVVLASHYDPAPALDDSPLAQQRPCTVTHEVLYRNLFHGPLFQSVASLDHYGDDGLVGSVCVPPRDRWFASQRDPAVLLDPVLLDVAMHLLGAWHLEQPDWTGRILLPFELRRIEFFGPTPPPGTRLRCRSSNEQASARHFRHGLQIAYPDGRLWARLSGAGYWRFYLPFGQVNFFGPKDEYYLSRAWPEALPEGVDATQACCQFLEMPADLRQVVLRAAGVRVTMTPQEIAQFGQLTDPDEWLDAWLFGRIVGKDAIRGLYSARDGERMFPADIELDWDHRSATHAQARRRDGSAFVPAPTVAIARVADKVAAVATVKPRVGLALASLPKGSSTIAPEQLEPILAQAIASAWGESAASLRVLAVPALTLAEQQARTLLVPVAVAVDLPQQPPALAAHAPGQTPAVAVRVSRLGDILAAVTFGEGAHP